jgi:hypothetical protein
MPRLPEEAHGSCWRIPMLLWPTVISANSAQRSALLRRRLFQETIWLWSCLSSALSPWPVSTMSGGFDRSLPEPPHALDGQVRCGQLQQRRTYTSLRRDLLQAETVWQSQSFVPGRWTGAIDLHELTFCRIFVITAPANPAMSWRRFDVSAARMRSKCSADGTEHRRRCARGSVPMAKPSDGLGDTRVGESAKCCSTVAYTRARR